MGLTWEEKLSQSSLSAIMHRSDWIRLVSFDYNHSILTLTLLHLLTFLNSDTFSPSRWDRQDFGHMTAALPIINYVDSTRGSLNTVLDACKAGAFAADSFRTFAKRHGAALTALHNGRACCVLECISSWDSLALPLTFLRSTPIGRFLMGCGPAISGFRGAGVERWLLIYCPCYLMLVLVCSRFKL